MIQGIELDILSILKEFYRIIRFLSSIIIYIERKKQIDSRYQIKYSFDSKRILSNYSISNLNKYIYYVENKSIENIELNILSNQSIRQLNLTSIITYSVQKTQQNRKTSMYIFFSKLVSNFIRSFDS